MEVEATPSTSGTRPLSLNEGINDGDTLESSSKRIRLQDHSFVEVEHAFNGKLKTFYLSNVGEIQDICLFLTHSKEKISSVVKKLLVQYGALKFNLLVESLFTKKLTHEVQLRSFKTKNFTVFATSDLDSILHKMFKKICIEESEYFDKGSGWSLKRVEGILLRFSRYRPLSGSSFIPLPDVIQRKKAVINPQNYNDNKCFLWALLARDIKKGHSPHVVDRKYHKLVNKFNTDGISFPTPLKQVKKFEKLNPDVSINVYGISDEEEVYPLVVCDLVKQNHYDLLFITNNQGVSHYAYITNFSRLVNSQISKDTHALLFCKRCFTRFRGKNKEKLLKEHMTSCGKIKPVRVKMPCEENDDTTLKFKNFHYQDRFPFVVYADFECLLKNSKQRVSNFTQIDNTHVPMSFGTYLVVSDYVPEEVIAHLPQEPYIYRGPDAAKEFMSYLIQLANTIGDILKISKPLSPLTDEEHIRYCNTTNCELCNCEFTMLNTKVRDHCHLSGKFRSVLCNSCNLQRQNLKYLPVFIHGSSNYDSHFIVRQLGCDSQNIYVIPHSSEKYITFSKQTSSGIALRFIDTYKFMSDSLSKLANNLPCDKFIHTKKCFSEIDLKYVTRKGVYPYDYTNSWSRLDDTELPDRVHFYNKMEERHINDDEYTHAQDVWKHFKCKTLGEYSDLYLRIDILLLCDVFENFRSLSIVNYGLDCAYYYTLPGLTFDAMLKFTKVELELFQDYDKYLFVEKGIRGGITTCVTRHGQANNPLLENHYDPDKPVNYLTYIDANNLYGWAMTKPIPLDSFEWKTDNLYDFDVLSIADDSPIGYILEVDVEYPSYLHPSHNALPFLPEIKCPLGSKQGKLLATLEPKQRYVCHYVNLKQALKNGLVLKRIHRILQFNQSCWLAPYIKFNTAKRINAQNDFDKDFYKFIINAMFGKTIENLRKRKKLELVSTHRKLNRLVCKPTFLNRIIYDETLCAVESESVSIYFNKPIYIGFTVLELSKTRMYELHYSVMKKLYNDNIQLLYLDTDSFIYNIHTSNVYKEIKENNEVKSYFDMSDLPQNHVGHFNDNKKKLGCFKDECKGVGMVEFIGLRAKLYAFRTVNDVKKKAKGITRPAIKRIEFDDFRSCLTSYVNIRKEMRVFLSKKHIVHTVQIDKLALNGDDNKRFVCDDGITTLAYGHFRLNEKLKERFVSAIYNDE